MRKRIARFLDMKQNGEPIAVLTGYDALTAAAEEAAGVDIILVGDSVGTTMLGYKSEREVTLADMQPLFAAALRYFRLRGSNLELPRQPPERVVLRQYAIFFACLLFRQGFGLLSGLGASAIAGAGGIRDFGCHTCVAGAAGLFSRQAWLHAPECGRPRQATWLGVTPSCATAARIAGVC
ncbi:MAG: 3-methyl-2-oxobutanoate hydroxymethyltransferase [Methylocella sp.]